MDANLGFLGVGAALALAAVGSALGTGIAGQAAIGAWKKCYANNKAAPFILVAFAGAPLTQTIYGFILMSVSLLGAAKDAAAGVADAANPLMILGAGIFGGLAMGFSAYAQGKAAAAAADAMAETGKGTANYFMVIGIVETVALFVMVLMMISI
jgi:V/A-type H+-transporting ATPase subunit K